MEKEAVNTIDHLKAILILPFNVLIIIPVIILYFEDASTFIFHSILSRTAALIIGLFLFGLGIPLFVQSIRLFIKIGKGTLAPWNPTKKLVVKSLYRHMRNPMISGVLLNLLALSFTFQSNGILIWFGIFFLMNNIYFILREEPDLEKRFGEEYLDYKKHVPRWIPRLRGWYPEKEH